MAEEHEALLKQGKPGVEAWNAWRRSPRTRREPAPQPPSSEQDRLALAAQALRALLDPLTNQRPLPPGAWVGAAASPFMAAGSNGSSTLVSSTNTVVFTPDWKSNDTAFGSFEAGAG